MINSYSGTTRPNLPAMVFSIIAMVLSGYSAVTAFKAFGHTSDASIYKIISHRPDIIAGILAEYGKKISENEGYRSDIEAKKLGNVLYTSPMKIGNVSRPANIVEFMDYRCVYCKASIKAIDSALSINKNASLVIRQLPILGDESKLISRYSLAAEQQGKFGALHQALLKNDVKTHGDVVDLMRQVGINVSKAEAFVRSKTCDKLVAEDAELARKLNLHATPAFIINNHVIQGWNGDLVSKALLKPTVVPSTL